ncbi:MAG: hypothetical protein ACI9YL_002062 [Luteibaculaceae bacterium]|jgi:hypothetical protein
MKKLSLVLAGATLLGASLFTSCSKESGDFASAKNKTTVGDNDDKRNLLDLDMPFIAGVNLSDELDGNDAVDYQIDDIILDANTGHLEASSFYGIESKDGTQVVSALDESGNVMASTDYNFEDGKFYEVVLTGDGTVDPYGVKVYELDYDFTTALLDEEGEITAINGLNTNNDLEYVSIQTQMDNDQFGTTIPSLADLQVDMNDFSTTTTSEDPIEASARLINSGSELMEDLVDGSLVSIGSDEVFNEDLGIMRFENGDDYTVFVLGDEYSSEITAINMSESLRNIDLSYVELDSEN